MRMGLLAPNLQAFGPRGEPACRRTQEHLVHHVALMWQPTALSAALHSPAQIMDDDMAITGYSTNT